MPYKNVVCGIYCIRRIGTEECYVGQSVNILNRWRIHRADLAKGAHHSRRLQRVYDRHGIEVLQFSILETCPDPKDKQTVTAAEQRWLDALKPCYNSAPVAASLLGMKRSPEAMAACSAGQKRRFERPEERERLAGLRRGLPSPWRGQTPSSEALEKMSAAHKGRPSPFKGKKHSAEALAKMSAARKGKPSPNKGKISPMKGVPRSDEVKSKISVANKGRPSPLKGRRVPRKRKRESADILADLNLDL